jgi:hypothetical protein
VSAPQYPLRGSDWQCWRNAITCRHAPRRPRLDARGRLSLSGDPPPDVLSAVPASRHLPSPGLNQERRAIPPPLNAEGSESNQAVRPACDLRPPAPIAGVLRVSIEMADRDTRGQEARQAISRTAATCGPVVTLRDTRQRHDRALRSACGRHRDHEHEHRDRLVGNRAAAGSHTSFVRRATTAGVVTAMPFQSPLAPNLY